MKKFIPLILAAALCLPFAALAEDAVSSASVADFYGQTALTGDDLMNAINSFSGFYLVTTTNPDNSPNAAFFVFGMVKHEDHYYVQLSLAENQSRSNLLANGEGVAVYAATPSSEEGAKPFATSGARIRFKAITDEAVAAALAENAPGTPFFPAVTPLCPSPLADGDFVSLCTLAFTFLPITGVHFSLGCHSALPISPLPAGIFTPSTAHGWWKEFVTHAAESVLARRPLEKTFFQTSYASYA